ncbi:hypothetical protein VNO78_35125 [Psophocarpus tetragonolobus]|uniref:Uncharacterized protein n=1 Tax=Psophocarpus tetragonolobus TaxID=3891 RepID=A0AAN9RLB2_PSOTE
MLTLKPGKAALTGKAVKRDEFNGKARSNKRRLALCCCTLTKQTSPIRTIRHGREESAALLLNGIEEPHCRMQLARKAAHDPREGAILEKNKFLSKNYEKVVFRAKKAPSYALKHFLVTKKDSSDHHCCPKTIGELRVIRVIGALRQAFKLGIRRSGLPQVQERCELIFSRNPSQIFSAVLAAFFHMGLFPTAVMSSRYASSTVLSFLGLRKIGRIDTGIMPFERRATLSSPAACPVMKAPYGNPSLSGLVNGVEIGYGQSPITRIGIREPSRCV